MNSLRHRTGTLPAETASFALLHLDQTLLLIPQADVRVLDLTMDVTRENPPPGGVGWVRFGERQHPVYAPSPRLEWLTEVPAGRIFCALMESDKRLFGLLCTEVGLVKSNALKFYAIPAAMTTPDSPFQQLVMHEGKLACLTSAAKILANLPPLGSEL